MKLDLVSISVRVDTAGTDGSQSHFIHVSGGGFDIFSIVKDATKRKEVKQMDETQTPAPAPQPEVIRTEEIPSGIAFSLRIPTSMLLLGGFLVAKYGLKINVPSVTVKK